MHKMAMLYSSAKIQRIKIVEVVTIDEADKQKWLIGLGCLYSCQELSLTSDHDW